MALLLAGGLLFVPALEASAQALASVRVDENFRREPNGLILARMSAGASVHVLDRRDDWSQVELQGWMWLPSLQVSDDPDLGLVVAAEGGENLRAGPAGPVVARVVDGALLAELERTPSWARVSRVGWVWNPSLDQSAEASPDGGGEGSERSGGPGTLDESAVLGRPAMPVSGRFVAVEEGPILAAPDGDTLAVARPASDVQVVGREGNWARVRLEGWMWLPAVQDAETLDPSEASAPLDPSEVADDPAATAGRVVVWSLQFLSLERAEAVRTDFFEGEPFLLTRFGDRAGPFVYVAVPNDRLAEVRGLLPLERIEVRGRVRTPASSLTGVPILDLIDFERVRDDR